MKSRENRINADLNDLEKNKENAQALIFYFFTNTWTKVEVILILNHLYSE